MLLKSPLKRSATGHTLMSMRLKALQTQCLVFGLLTAEEAKRCRTSELNLHKLQGFATACERPLDLGGSRVLPEQPLGWSRPCCGDSATAQRPLAALNSHCQPAVSAATVLGVARSNTVPIAQQRSNSRGAIRPPPSPPPAFAYCLMVKGEQQENLVLCADGETAATGF